jgi:hypothetical protein
MVPNQRRFSFTQLSKMAAIPNYPLQGIVKFYTKANFKHQFYVNSNYSV